MTAPQLSDATPDANAALIAELQARNVELEHQLQHCRRELQQMRSTAVDISESKEAERAAVQADLRQSKEQRRMSLEFGRIGSWDWDFVTQQGSWNDQHYRIVGLVPGQVEASYELWRSCMHPDDRERVEQALNHAIATHTDLNEEYRVVHPDGSIRWVISRGQAVYDAMGRVVRVLGVIQDVSDRKQVEQELRLSQERFAGILDIASDAIISIDAHQRITLFNQGAERMFGYSSEEVLGHPLNLLMPDRFAASHTAHVRGFAPTEERPSRRMGERSEVFGRRKDGTEFPAEASISKLTLGGESIFTAILRDVSDRKRVEAALRRQAEREQTLNRVVQTIRNSLDLETIFTTAVQAIGVLLQVDSATVSRYCPDQALWQPVAEYLHHPGLPSLLGTTIPDDGNPVAERLKRLEVVQLDDATRLSDPVNRLLAEQYPPAWLLVPLPDMVTGQGCGIWGCLTLMRAPRMMVWQNWEVEVAQVVSDQLAIAIQQSNLFQQVRQLNQELEQRVQQRTAQLSMALSATHTGTWEWNLQTQQKRWSPQTYALLGLDHSEAPSHELFLRQIHPDDLPLFHQACQQALETRSLYQCEFRVIWSDGSIHWIYERGAYSYDEAGQAIHMDGVGMDITKRKLAEEQLRASLKEKEVLLKEIHHRVKNNLQVVSSLLRMQSRQIDDEQIRSLFMEAQNRVQSMALIHEQLYQAPDLAGIDFGDYVHILVNNLFRSYGVSPQLVVPTIHTEDITLPVNTAIPCGLIVNELVSNVLKYAFPNRQTGQVLIQLQPNTSDDPNARSTITLTVSDNGVGLPESFQLETAESLGLLIVTSLTDQLDGTLQIERSPGTSFHVTFPQP